MASHHEVPLSLVDGDLETIIVGVDIGLTCTGVAFCSVRDSKINVIKTWPVPEARKRDNPELHDKVPTALYYRVGDTTLHAWGFRCPPPGEVQPKMGVLDRFKLYLDESFLDETFRCHPSHKPGSHEDVRRWYKDFLSKLYDHIVKTVSKFYNLIDWNSATVQFVFSVPTLWDGVAVADDFEKIAREAGFGNGGRNHSLEFDLNEAEAAAIYTARSSKHQKSAYVLNQIPEYENVGPTIPALPERPKLEKGNVIVVADSGGGTTDIATLRVESIRPFPSEDKEEEIADLTTLEPIDGLDSRDKAVGSVQIDEAFQRAVETRLALLPPQYLSTRTLEILADEIVRNRFLPVKHEFGKPSLRGQSTFYFLVPGLPSNFNHEEARIENGRLVFTRNEIKALFDAQILGIFKLINAQLDRFGDVTHIVLSGGLGSSDYVQERVLERYGPEGAGKQVLVQLAVCNGLVIDKLHRIKYAHAIIAKRTCRASYGILCNEPYNQERHRNARIAPETHRSRLDGQKYVGDYIHWLVKRGQPVVRDQPVSHRFFRLVGRSDVDSIRPPEDIVRWVDGIAMSKAPPERLPMWLNEGDAERVGEIKSALPGTQFYSTDGSHSSPASSVTNTAVRYFRRRNMFRRLIAEYWKVDLELRMYAGPAGLRFEIRCGDRRIGGTDHIPVSWVYPPARRGLDVLVFGDGNDALVETVAVGQSDPDWARRLVPVTRRSFNGDTGTLEEDTGRDRVERQD